MFLAGAIMGHGVRILIDTGAMHNIIDTNFAHLVGIMELRINMTILVGSGNEIADQGACFNMPLCINTETFQIDTFLVNLSIDVDIILATPWMANLGTIL